MYCSSCGTQMDKHIWLQSAYCLACGKPLMKAVESGSGGVTPSRSVRTQRVVTALQATRGTVTQYPLLVSVGSIGLGAAGIMVSPLLMIAGQWMTGLGIGAWALGWIAESALQDGQYRDGMNLGAKLAGLGLLVYGSSYVVLSAGAITALFGVGLGAITGVQAYIGYRRMKQVIAAQPLMLTEGGNDEN